MKEKIMLGKSISFKLTQEEYELLRKRADEEERPMGQIIRRAIRKFIKAEIGSSN